MMMMLLLVNGRSIWADYLTDDPTAWRVRVGEHHMFSEQDADQVDVNVRNIIFHPRRNRNYQSLFLAIFALCVYFV